METLSAGELLLYVLPLLWLMMGLLAAGHILLNKRDPKAAFGWIALCIILPVAGPLIYVLFGINRINQRARRDYQIKVPRDDLYTINEPDGSNFRPLSSIGENLTRKGLCDCTELRLLENGEQLYPAMIECINNARSRVLLASYIFDHNSSGLKIAEALAAAVKRGVEVKVIIDGMGEFMTMPRIGHHLKKLGIPFCRFNPITLFPPALNINMRNHRKLLIIDGEWAFTGGQNIGDRHLATRDKDPNRVLDLHFRLKGKIVDELEWAFWKDWAYCEEKHEVPGFHGSNTLQTHSDIWTRLILDGPNKDIDKLNYLMVGVISAAQQQILIMTPYFLPMSDMVGVLIAAHLRGVRVGILVPGHNNIKPVHWAMHNSIRQLLEAGLDIRMQPAPFVHSKLLLIDNQYSLIGSANIDQRSLRLNYELGVEIFSDQVNASLCAYFRERESKCTPLTLEQINQRSIPVKLRDSIAWLFSPYL
jgi:cardiolipin synthase A/B